MNIITRIIYDWGVRCFGADHMHNNQERALRMAEEAIELCQCIGVPIDKIKLCADIVYQRPRGTPLQEMGGVFVTSHAFCAAQMMNGNGHAWEPDHVLEREVRRCLGMSPEHFQRRNKEKQELGLRAEA